MTNVHHCYLFMRYSDFCEKAHALRRLRYGVAPVHVGVCHSRSSTSEKVLTGVSHVYKHGKRENWRITNFVTAFRIRETRSQL